MRDLVITVGCLKIADSKDIKQLVQDIKYDVDQLGKEITSTMVLLEKTLHQSVAVFKHVYQPLSCKAEKKPGNKISSTIVRKMAPSLEIMKMTKVADKSAADNISYIRAVEKSIDTLKGTFSNLQKNNADYDADLRSAGMTFVDKPEDMLQAQLNELQQKKMEYRQMVRLLESVKAAQFIDSHLFKNNESERKSFMSKPYDEVYMAFSAFLDKEQGRSSSEGSEKL